MGWTMTDHVCVWDLWEIFDGVHHCKVEGCRAQLTRQQAEDMLNAAARLKQQNGLLRQRLRYYGLGLIKEADKFDALKATEDELTP